MELSIVAAILCGAIYLTPIPEHFSRPGYFAFVLLAPAFIDFALGSTGATISQRLTLSAFAFITALLLVLAQMGAFNIPAG